MTSSLIKSAAYAAFIAVSFNAGAEQATQGQAATSQTQKTTPDMKRGDTASRQQQQQGAGTGEPTGPAVLVLLPVHLAGADALGNGCWVRFYDAENFRGANLTLVGPVDMNEMNVPGTFGAWRNWDSAVVGPKAQVTVYDQEDFKERNAVLKAGSHIADLSANKLGWFEDVKSARVACGSGPASSPRR